MKVRSSRLLALQNELKSLDNEIEDINKFLDEPSDDEEESQPQFSISQNYSKNSSSFIGKQKENRLYKESIEILEKRTHQTTDLSGENETFLIPKKTFKLKNYKPPSQRLDESRIRRSQSVKRYKEQSEREFREECTFRPKINRRKDIEENYDPDHLIRPTPRKRAIINNTIGSETTPKKLINKKSAVIADMIETKKGDDFYSRQARHRRSQSVRDSDAYSGSKRKTITKAEEQEMLEHLMKPRKRIQPNDEKLNVTPRKKKSSDPSVFEHLVSQSLRKEEPIPDEPAIKPVMNARSRKLTENVQVNLFEQSLASKMKRERAAAEQKNWEEMQKLGECTFRPKIIHRRRREVEKPVVAGMDDYVDRMKKCQVEEEDEIKPIPKVRRGAVMQKPFSFDQRVQKKHVPDEKAVDNVLSEINRLLAIV